MNKLKLTLFSALSILILTGCAHTSPSYNPDRWERPKVKWQDTYDNIKKRQYYNRRVKN